MRLIRAIFNGEDGSMGYKKGELYFLELMERDGKYAVEIKRLDGTGYCPYSTYYSFLVNWLKPEAVEPRADEKVFYEIKSKKAFVAKVVINMETKQSEYLVPLWVKTTPKGWKEVNYHVK